MYHLVSVDRTAAPEGINGRDWCRYIIARHCSTIVGYRRGTAQQVTQYTRHHAEELSEEHLRAVFTEYVIHYHEERNHQGLDNPLIKPATEVRCIDEPVKRRERVGGLLSYHHREAALQYRRWSIGTLRDGPSEHSIWCRHS